MTTQIDLIASGPHQSVHVYSNGELRILREFHSTKQYMQHLCLGNGTTLEGCYEASRLLIAHAYKRPIYIGGNCNQIFIPTSSVKKTDCVWVSLDFLMNETLQDYNEYGYEVMSMTRWQKHLSDGIALRLAIFRRET